jgi:hypothetical protein
MQLSVAARLNPLSILLCVEVRDAKNAFEQTIRSVCLNFGGEADEGGIPFEDHVEFAHLVALHSVRAVLSK